MVGTEASLECLCACSGSPGGLLIEFWGLVAVVLIDLVIMQGFVQLRDTQVKYCRIDRVGRMAGGSGAAQRA